ncbi:MAG TPA: single-stranded-DNA-specific exonuclease RecJ [Caldithrix abyssi]|uniref:Single-stranded-DNA-specific exonuclease RecJ n=1 Tax=Caldithrix abyssi TaxID=187145 RepID=A0A7V4UEZ0_CALAY|nr:single-stranded-DNA-specific exonuclease RecJ [Caldithrix abyssi]
MIYQWNLPKKTDDKKIVEISQSYQLHPIIASILYNRQIRTTQEIQKYFDTDLESLYDPFLFSQMGTAVDRIIKALKDGENILIYGDYDVDGVTAVSILYDGLFRMGGKVSFFIPNRFVEGYGVSEKGIQKAKARDVSLIITVDCGITALKEVDYAREQGMDVIICDHHEPAGSLPDAVAILDPKVKGCSYPYKELAGCGVAFKLLQAITERLGFNKDFAYQYLDLVAVGTAADIVQLLDENRILVKHGLAMLNSNPRPGVFALLENCGLLGRELSVNTIVFILAPRLNAVGRISSAKKAVHLLTTQSLQQGKNIARILEKENRARKDIDVETFEEAKALIRDRIDLDTKRVIVLAKENWHPGVIGIVASRLMEKFHRPTVLISIQDGVGKGSARSTPNFDIYSAFQKLDHHLLTYGGHRFAAGLTIEPERIEEFDAAINLLAEGKFEMKDLIPKLDIDAIINFDQFNAGFFSGLKTMAPFGPGNMRPVFATYNLLTYGPITVVGNNHLKLKCKQGDVVIDAIGYNLGSHADEMRKPHRQLNCAYVLDETYWNGQTTIQMRIKDFEVF